MLFPFSLVDFNAPQVARTTLPSTVLCALVSLQRRPLAIVGRENDVLLRQHVGHAVDDLVREIEQAVVEVAGRAHRHAHAGEVEPLGQVLDLDHASGLEKDQEMALGCISHWLLLSSDLERGCRTQCWPYRLATYSASELLAAASALQDARKSR